MLQLLEHTGARVDTDGQLVTVRAAELDRPEETDWNVCPSGGRLRALRLGVSVFVGATTLTV